MSKEDVKERYGDLKQFEYEVIGDRNGFKQGDWTDDSDQMILILLSLLDKKGKVCPLDFAQRMQKWASHGMPELGDKYCVDIGITTSTVVHQKNYLTEPNQCAKDVWKLGGCTGAPNGGVMRTSVLGLHEYWDIEKVIKNTVDICGTTHADHRCKASCVAVTTSIAFMLQGEERFMKPDGTFDVKAIMNESFDIAKAHLKDEAQVNEMKQHMFAESLSDLELDRGGIGYTFKTMGAGFWAFQQEDFREALEAITRAGGDADTNGAVAGALLGCKLGTSGLPKPGRMD